MKGRVIGCLVVVLACLSAGARAGFPSEGSERGRSGGQHVVFLHGSWLETHGLDEPHPAHGFDEYDRIVETLANRGYRVIGELRQGRSHPEAYAGKAADQVRQLIEAGVPPRDAAVVGHSKGGQRALVVSSLVREADVAYVVMAGCGRGGAPFRRRGV